MADNEVGAALVGPFDRFLSQYDLMRRAEVEDRGKSMGPPTPSLEEQIAAQKEYLANPPPVTKLGVAGGMNDVAPITPEELLKYMFVNEATGPDPQQAVPLPRPRPKGR